MELSVIYKLFIIEIVIAYNIGRGRSQVRMRWMDI
jgi:hypothetical protein